MNNLMRFLVKIMPLKYLRYHYYRIVLFVENISKSYPFEYIILKQFFILTLVLIDCLVLIYIILYIYINII